MRAAIVGLGSWGQKLVLAVHGKTDAISITRGVTRTVEKVAAFAEKTGIPIDSDYGSVLADPAIDAVILATPHSQHVEQVVQAAEAGKHVFVEKPLALTRAGVVTAFDACERNGVLLAVGQNRRFLPAVREIRKLIDDGEIGQVLHIEGNYSGPSGWRHSQSIWRASAAESPWGGMTGKGLHVSDLMIHFAGPIREVDARSIRQVLTTDMDDTTVVVLGFTSGALGTLASLTATADVWRLQVFGSKGWVEMRWHETLVVCRINEQERILNFDPVDIERAELEAFAEAVRTASPFPVPRADVENNIAFLEAIGRSVGSSGAVQIKEG
jgi:predicted dehydrogenase